MKNKFTENCPEGLGQCARQAVRAVVFLSCVKSWRPERVYQGCFFACCFSQRPRNILVCLRDGSVQL